MLVIGQLSINCFYIRRRTYRQRKKSMKKPCITKPDALKCAVRHTRCEECPFKDFFKPDNPLKYIHHDL